MHELIKNFIDGEWVGAAQGTTKTTKNINPATGESLGEVVLSGKAEAEAARSRRPRRRCPPGSVRRRRVVARSSRRAAVEMTKRKEELARALTAEEGKLYARRVARRSAEGDQQHRVPVGRRAAAQRRDRAVGAAVDDVLDAARGARRGGAGDAVEFPGGDPGVEARARR